MVPAMFIFGDSLIDNGNNNNLPSFAKANYYPYGIDFDGGPTGRFSNGYTMVDEIEATGEAVMHGLNYASAAAGILDITNFESTLDQITDNLGADAVSQSIAKCIFFIGMGSNDYLNNYMMPNYNTRNQYTPTQYANLLVQEFTRQLTVTLSLCVLAQAPNGRCSDDVDNLVVPFNYNVRSMVDGLNANLPGSKFIHIDIYHMFKDILNNPRLYGFSVADRGCCGIGRNHGQITCLPFQTPCPNRDRYVFWDAFHPTAKVNVIMARWAFDGDASVVYPMNIKQLASL
ncbi:GDSL esterase/lipase [Acorus calamus]|uniref:GDSL esterase/lipase n=1 Tax=Acorus calamus TaxID=4465 RepID=A0AAV9ECC7_ACOCL|nr:GDSL esterase/lipase [Acorus calamus]